MRCHFCSGASPAEHEAIAIQAGQLFPNAVPRLMDNVFYPVCHEHRVGNANQLNVSVKLSEEGSPASDLHMVLDFIREYFRDKSLPGMEGSMRHIGIENLEDERLSALIRRIRPLLVLRKEIEEFITSNGLD